MKFADDGTIWAAGDNPSELAAIIEKELHKLLSWTLKWRMKLSAEKTEICLFSRDNLNGNSTMLKVHVNGKDISYNPNPKVLGLHLDESLNYQNHIKKTEQKANKAIGVLRQINHVEKISTVKLVQLYKSLICPISEYAYPVW